MQRSKFKLQREICPSLNSAIDKTLILLGNVFGCPQSISVNLGNNIYFISHSSCVSFLVGTQQILATSCF